MKKVQIMIIVDDELTGYDLDNMQEFSIELKDGKLEIIAVEKHATSINLKDVNLLPHLTETPSKEIRRAPHKKESHDKQNNLGKLSYENFTDIFEEYIRLQNEGAKGDIMRLFEEWSNKCGVNVKTLHVWFSQTKKQLSGDKNAYKALNKWIVDYCEQYKKELEIEQ